MSSKWEPTIFGTAAKRPDLACGFCGDDNVALGHYGSHYRCGNCGAIYCRRNCQLTPNGGCPGCRSDRGDFLEEALASQTSDPRKNKPWWKFW